MFEVGSTIRHKSSDREHVVLSITGQKGYEQYNFTDGMWGDVYDRWVLVNPPRKVEPRHGK